MVAVPYSALTISAGWNQGFYSGQLLFQGLDLLHPTTFHKADGGYIPRGVLVWASTSKLQWSPLFMNPTVYRLQWCKDDQVPSAFLLFQLHNKIILLSLNWVRAMLGIKTKPPLSRKHPQSHIIKKKNLLSYCRKEAKVLSRVILPQTCLTDFQ